ncbi:hypothetical protein SK128_018433 [Halocaridina rubra]|uniref:Uncharacterized protein n=1 Tax=Halocaridina rubra TaxID=373956 RepID=A0AAN9AA62_HALRR
MGGSIRRSKYNDRLGILRNACQIPGCPHYLQPHNNYNQHLYIEREQEDFPHSLHLVSHEFHRLGLDGVLQEVTSGNHGGTNARKRPPPPSPGALQPLTEEIKTLLTIYSEK